MAGSSLNIQALLPQLRRYAMKLCAGRSQDSEDLVQSTCLRMLESMHLYQDRGKPIAWAVTIMRNLHLQKFKRPAMVQWPEFYDYTDGLTSEDVLIHQETLSKIDELRPKHRELIRILAQDPDCSLDDMAAKCNIPVGTVKSRLSRARAKLAEMSDA